MKPTFFLPFRPLPRGAACLALAAALFLPGADRAHAHGELGEDIKDLQAHLGEYEEDLRKVIVNYAGVVDTYASEGADGLDTMDLLKFWEEAEMHYAIELNYIPIYAKIWQSIYGIKEGIDKGQPAEDVQRTQETLEETLWQALGAVKMAAKVQASEKAEDGEHDHEDHEEEDHEEPSSPVETITVIQDKLDRVMAKCAERDYEAATEMVHDTYLNLFEGIEGQLIEQDADLVVDLEKDFNVTLPKQIEAEAALAEIQKSTAAMKKKLDRASELLSKAEKDKKEVF